MSWLRSDRRPGMLMKVIKDFHTKKWVTVCNPPNNPRQETRVFAIPKGVYVMYVKQEKTLGRKRNEHIILHEGKTFSICETDDNFLKYFKPLKNTPKFNRKRVQKS